MLLQLGGDELLHPVAYFSQKHLPSEKNYPVHDKELLSILKALKHWRRYLEGTEYSIKIYTDHKNLIYFTESRRISQRHARWVIELSNFSFTISYKKGIANIVPDALSRHPNLSVEDFDYNTLNTTNVLSKDQFVNSLVLSTPESCILESIKMAQLEDPDFSRIYQEITNKQPSKPGYTVLNDLLHFYSCIVVPTSKLQMEVIINFHDSPPAGHMGYKKTLSRLRDYFWWPLMAKTVQHEVKSFMICVRSKKVLRCQLDFLSL